MKEMEIRQKFYDKLQKEFKDFIEEVKKKEPEVIVDSAYQIAIKEELVGIFFPQEDKYDIEEIKALNKLPDPLEELYQGWMDCDGGIHTVLEDSVSLTLEDVLEQQKEKKKDRER